jgi:hypothetical protein
MPARHHQAPVKKRGRRSSPRRSADSYHLNTSLRTKMPMSSSTTTMRMNSIMTRPPAGASAAARPSSRRVGANAGPCARRRATLRTTRFTSVPSPASTRREDPHLAHVSSRGRLSALTRPAWLVARRRPGRDPSISAHGLVSTFGTNKLAREGHYILRCPPLADADISTRPLR